MRRQAGFTMIELVTVMGIHSVNLAIPILLEEAEKAGA